MTVNLAAGSRVFIGPAVDESVNTLAEYDALAYIEVGEAQSIGKIGDEWKIATFESLSRRRVRKRKASVDGGALEIVCGTDPTDAGQMAMKAAEETDDRYAIKVLANNRVTKPKSAVVTMTIANPGVVSWADHGFDDGCEVVFSTTGALPTGLVAGTVYYIVQATEDAFKVASVPDGTPIETTGTQSGVHTAKAQGAPTMYYTQVLVASAPDQFGTNEQFVTTTFMCPVDSETLERAAT